LPKRRAFLTIPRFAFAALYGAMAAAGYDFRYKYLKSESRAMQTKKSHPSARTGMKGEYHE
jgi:hypothetical protein